MTSGFGDPAPNPIRPEEGVREARSGDREKEKEKEKKERDGKRREGKAKAFGAHVPLEMSSWASFPGEPGAVRTWTGLTGLRQKPRACRGVCGMEASQPGRSLYLPALYGLKPCSPDPGACPSPHSIWKRVVSTWRGCCPDRRNHACKAAWR